MSEDRDQMTRGTESRGTISRGVGALMRAFVALYRYGVSPLLPPSCRYQPTCSAYAMEAIDRHGPLKGGLLAIRRILRCHPLGGHGFDPVPDPPRDQF